MQWLQIAASLEVVLIWVALTQCCPQALDRYAGYLWEASEHSGQASYWPGFPVHLTKLQNTKHLIEALPRVRFKFPGHQKIRILKKWGFTKLNGD